MFFFSWNRCRIIMWIYKLFCIQLQIRCGVLKSFTVKTRALKAPKNPSNSQLKMSPAMSLILLQHRYLCSATVTPERKVEECKRSRGNAHCRLCCQYERAIVALHGVLWCLLQAGQGPAFASPEEIFTNPSDIDVCFHSFYNVHHCWTKRKTHLFLFLVL